jgi:hypothetical protein
MDEVHEGGCACGNVRYRVKGKPRRVSACCCRWCQRRTGSVLGVSVYFAEEDVEFLSGSLRSYRLTSDAGRWIESRFCDHCGTTVCWLLEFLPDMIGLSGGTFDDPAVWGTPERFVFARSKPDWLCLSQDIPSYTQMQP